MGLVACSLTVGVGYALSGSGDDARTRSGATTVSEAPQYGKGDTVPAPEASETAGPTASASPSTSASASPSASASGTPAGTGAPSASRTASDEKTAAHTKGTTSRQSEQRTTAPRPSRTASAPRPSSPDTGTSGGDASLARQVADLANQERAKAGCAPLRVDSRLQAAAQAHADDMAARNYYEHTSPEGKSAGDRMEAAGYDWRTWGENIHKSPKDAQTAMRDWMDSPGHRENILNCEFKDLGVGVNLSSNGPWWVQNFGAGS
ncbi:CAP domain-containing protein [Streptomyces sp. MUM 178J]|uniref:CAP domain-containing protein n=1 Tax=Streptomyces sp. MUM 178J TaxID=2791991 RepID=UPI001F0375AC|nr:CAP domain-containing protein [Streptomyces sp. MUM 178J]WRQ82399.1 CAP domain-containing protein [Streptomyces sp. MUM 178J]